MHTFTFNDDQWRWLCTAVKYRIDDELAERREIGKREEALSINQMRIDMWQSIYNELTKDEVPPLVR